MFIQWERVLAPFMTNELYSIYILTFGCLDHHGMLIYIYKHTHIYRHKQPNTTHVYVYYMINEAKYMFQETNKQKQSKYCCLQKFFFPHTAIYKKEVLVYSNDTFNFGFNLWVSSSFFSFGNTHIYMRVFKLLSSLSKKNSPKKKICV